MNDEGCLARLLYLKERSGGSEATEKGAARMSATAWKSRRLTRGAMIKGTFAGEGALRALSSRKAVFLLQKVPAMRKRCVLRSRSKDGRDKKNRKAASFRGKVPLRSAWGKHCEICRKKGREGGGYDRHGQKESIWLRKCTSNRHDFGELSPYRRGKFEHSSRINKKKESHQAHQGLAGARGA